MPKSCSSAPPLQVAKVALALPSHCLFDYHLLPDVSLEAGDLVVVPFRTRELVGVVIQLGLSQAPVARIKPILRRHHDLKIPPSMLAFIQFANRYYCYFIGMSLLRSLPKTLRSANENPLKPSPPAFQLSCVGKSISLQTLPTRAHAQRRLLEMFQTHPTLTAAQAKAACPSAAKILQTFEAKNWIFRTQINQVSSPPYQFISAKFQLTTEQQQAIQQCCPHPSNFQCSLLHGITGSGKTEVYLQCIHQTLQHTPQAQVLLLVPEINLTPQLLQQTQDRFPNTRIASCNSAHSPAVRTAHWLAIYHHQAQIIIGTRSALFLPFRQLQLVIVDEEHDPSYKQMEGLRYHGRDLAIWLAKHENIPIILGSATPSLEILSLVQKKRCQHLRLTQRSTPDAQLPNIRYIDMRLERSRHNISRSLLEALKERLAKQEQSLIFINRRGYAPVIFCPDCQWLPLCKQCNRHLVLHQDPPTLHCHLCGLKTPAPTQCPQCQHTPLLPLGHGTQRYEETLQAQLPNARIVRIDRDNHKNLNALSATFERIQRQQVDIIVGTQMLTKGHHFKKITLVGVLDADHGLFSADFRSAERLFAMLQQVAGRAGRDTLPGTVMIQTQFPTHPLFQALAAHDFDQFSEQQMQIRQQVHLPPISYHALLYAESAQPKKLTQFMHQARQQALTQCTQDPTTHVYDAIDMNIAKRSGQHRMQLLLEASQRNVLHHHLRAWIPQLTEIAHKVRWGIDVDPTEY